MTFAVIELTLAAIC